MSGINSPTSSRGAFVVDGVFDADAAEEVHCHEAHGVWPDALGEIQAKVRSRFLRALTRRGLLEREDAHAMNTWDHSGGL